ncbi:hypothetical protein BJX99DRAFT_218667 [Aspergillus californicus]
MGFLNMAGLVVFVLEYALARACKWKRLTDCHPHRRMSVLSEGAACVDRPQHSEPPGPMESSLIKSLGLRRDD